MQTVFPLGCSICLIIGTTSSAQTQEMLTAECNGEGYQNLSFTLTQALSEWNRDREISTKESRVESDPVSDVLDSIEAVYRNAGDLWEAEIIHFVKENPEVDRTFSAITKENSALHPNVKAKFIRSLSYVYKKESTLPGMA